MKSANRPSMAEALAMWLRGTFRYRGRARRSELAWVALVLLIISVAGLTGVTALSSDMEAGFPLWRALFTVSVLAAVPTCALVWRRVHDMGHSGLWTLAWTPFLTLVLVLPIIPLVLGALALSPGTRGANRFGPEPGAVDRVGVFD